MDLGPMELIIIFAVFLLLFGANKLPSLGEGLGKALRGFKEAMRGEGEGASPATSQKGEGEKAPPELPPAPVTPAEKPEKRGEQDGEGAA